MDNNDTIQPYNHSIPATDLSFLAIPPWNRVESLYITLEGNRIENQTCISNCINLRNLEIHTVHRKIHFCTRTSIELSLPNLNYFYIDTPNKVRIINQVPLNADVQDFEKISIQYIEELHCNRLFDIREIRGIIGLKRIRVKNISMEILREFKNEKTKLELFQFSYIGNKEMDEKQYEEVIKLSEIVNFKIHYKGIELRRLSQYRAMRFIRGGILRLQDIETLDNNRAYLDKKFPHLQIVNIVELKQLNLRENNYIRNLIERFQYIEELYFDGSFYENYQNLGTFTVKKLTIEDSDQSMDDYEQIKFFNPYIHTISCPNLRMRHIDMFKIFTILKFITVQRITSFEVLKAYYEMIPSLRVVEMKDDEEKVLLCKQKNFVGDQKRFYFSLKNKIGRQRS